MHKHSPICYFYTLQVQILKKPIPIIKNLLGGRVGPIVQNGTVIMFDYGEQYQESLNKKRLWDWKEAVTNELPIVLDDKCHG